MNMSSRRIRRHTRPGHFCHYIGPVHVPKSVYDVWHAITDVHIQARALCYLLVGWIALMFLLSLAFAASGMLAPALTLQAMVAALVVFYMLRVHPRRGGKDVGR